LALEPRSGHVVQQKIAPDQGEVEGGPRGKGSMSRRGLKRKKVRHLLGGGTGGRDQRRIFVVHRGTHAKEEKKAATAAVFRKKNDLLEHREKRHTANWEEKPQG